MGHRFFPADAPDSGHQLVSPFSRGTSVLRQLEVPLASFIYMM